MGAETGGEGGGWSGGHFLGTPAPSAWRPVSASEPPEQHEEGDDQEVKDELGHLHHRQHGGAEPQAPLAAQVGEEGDHRDRRGLGVGFVVQLLEEDIDFGNSISFVLDGVIVLSRQHLEDPVL